MNIRVAHLLRFLCCPIVSLHSSLLGVMSVTISAQKRCSVRHYIQLIVGGLMSYFIQYLCWFVYSGVQHILCCVFFCFVCLRLVSCAWWCYVLCFLFCWSLSCVLCTQCCQFLNCPSGFSNVYLLGKNRSKSKLVKVMKNILYDFNRFSSSHIMITY
jgi:hypothetical protein